MGRRLPFHRGTCCSRATTRRPTALQLVEAIEGKAGSLTPIPPGDDLYWAKVAAPHLSETLDVLTDMLLYAAFDPVELEKERAVIVEEITMRSMRRQSGRHPDQPAAMAKPSDRARRLPAPGRVSAA